jgi:ferritin heavy chain
MAQAATATAPGAMHAFSSSTDGKVCFKASSVNVASWRSQPKCSLTVRASGGSEHAKVGYANTETGILFEPFAEVQSQLVKVSSSVCESLARQRFPPSCEAAINDQINVEYNVSYVYHALYAYFDRDNVGLPGFAKFFKENSEEEREHAEKLMKYQNKRGGRVKLNTISSPVMEFDHAEKGDALYSMELALAMEKLVNEKLLSLHQVAVDTNDPEMCDFIEGEYLNEQVEAIKKISVYVSQLRRVGKGHGVYHFDLQLQA